MTDDKTRQNQTWLAFAIEDSLRLGVLSPTQVLAHATPEVLAEHLPRELMVKVFASAFATGKLTPEGILEVAPPTTLVRHLAPGVLWGCLREAAEAQRLQAPTGVTAIVATGATPGSDRGRGAVRTWLGDLLRVGLETGLVTPAHVARLVPPREWVRDMPTDLVAKVMEAGLARGHFDAGVILSVLTPETLGEHLAPHLAWAVIEDGVRLAFALEPKPGARAT